MRHVLSVRSHRDAKGIKLLNVHTVTEGALTRTVPPGTFAILHALLIQTRLLDDAREPV